VHYLGPYKEYRDKPFGCTRCKKRFTTKEVKGEKYILYKKNKNRYPANKKRKKVIR